MYWFQKRKTWSDWNRWTAALVGLVMVGIVLAYVAVVHLGWRPSYFSFTMGWQAILFGGIAYQGIHHLLLPRIRRSA